MALSARIEKLLVTGRALVTVFMFAGNVEAQVFTAHTPRPPAPYKTLTD